MDIPQNRIAPSESFECTGNQRLFTSCDKQEEAGFDENHNFFLYERKDVKIMSEEIYRFIDFAAAHPELQYLVKYRGSWLVYIDRSTIIPLFARAVKVENIAMPDSWWDKIAEQKIVNLNGRITFDGVEKEPLSLKYSVISNQVRFGYATATTAAGRRFFAFHGSPCRNDDYFDISEITESEYLEIQKEYVPKGSQGRPFSDTFNEKFIKDHTIVHEGWDLPDTIWVEVK